jgi:integrase
MKVESNNKRFIFTKKAIEALPIHDPNSPSREAEYSEAAPTYSGMRLLVSKTGRKSWLWRYTFQGVKKSMALGEFPAVTLESARQRILEGKALLAQGINPAVERDKAKDELTFEEFADRYYMPFAKQHKLTWDDDQNFIKHMLPTIGTLKLTEIKPLHVATIHSLERGRTSPTTANHMLKTLKRMLNVAIKWQLLEKNPATHQEKFKEGPLRQRYLSKEELPRFLKALDEQEDNLSAAAIKLLLSTGARLHDIVSLKWENFRTDEKTVLLVKCKDGESRVLFLNERSMAVLSELKERKEMEPRTRDSVYVFPSRDGAKKPYIYDLRKTFQKVCKSAKIGDGLRIHDLRHTYASILASSNVPLLTISKLLGHKNALITQRYAHLASGDLKEATERVSKILDNAA